jgi:hypothetical protein
MFSALVPKSEEAESRCPSSPLKSHRARPPLPWVTQHHLTTHSHIRHAWKFPPFIRIWFLHSYHYFLSSLIPLSLFPCGLCFLPVQYFLGLPPHPRNLNEYHYHMLSAASTARGKRPHFTYLAFLLAELAR